ncbi:hypothetical protein [Mesorhizobium sp.]|uniref:hypothetical protein n=1 Tax=Mesorhizobium sp. TaxID=1871066 RepID=UPI000FEA7008|nr:hypothetical protein [Mesorhizobium sp.]RWG27914.1 MAG: hypothetical protein EOQ60_24325 [Mesorhizobium sp.]
MKKTYEKPRLQKRGRLSAALPPRRRPALPSEASQAALRHSFAAVRDRSKLLALPRRTNRRTLPYRW